MAPMRSPADARTRLDFWQAASGALLALFVCVHLLLEGSVVISPALPINVAGSAKRLHDGWLAFYVLFLPCVILHTGVGVYRLAVKYGVCTKAERARWRRWIWIVMGCYLVLGVLALTRVWFLG